MCIVFVRLSYIFKGDVAKLNQIDSILNELNLKDTSLWTIDIAHICALINLEHTMFTATIGVDQNYSSESFYLKDFHLEKVRIENKFKNSQCLGINLEKRSIHLEFIKAQLKKNCVCIVLVNAACLNGNELDSESLIDDDDLESQNFNNKKATCCYFYTSSNQSSEKEKLDSSSEIKNTNYFGHFIVLNGFDDRKSIVFYRNPASRKSLSYTSYLNFEKARLSYGTDEDILFIYF